MLPTLQKNSNGWSFILRIGEIPMWRAATDSIHEYNFTDNDFPTPVELYTRYRAGCSQ